MQPVAEQTQQRACPAGLSLHSASVTKTPTGEILSATTNWDTCVIFTSGLEKSTTVGTAAPA